MASPSRSEDLGTRTCDELIAVFLYFSQADCGQRSLVSAQNRILKKGLLPLKRGSIE